MLLDLKPLVAEMSTLRLDNPLSDDFNALSNPLSENFNTLANPFFAEEAMFEFSAMVILKTTFSRIRPNGISYAATH